MDAAHWSEESLPKISSSIRAKKIMIHPERFSRTDRRIYFDNHIDPVEQIAFFKNKMKYKSLSS